MDSKYGELVLNGYTGVMTAHPADISVAVAKIACPSRCSKIQTLVPANTQCYTWTFQEDAGMPTARAWQLSGYIINSEDDKHGHRVVLCTGACVGYNWLEC